MRIIRRKIVPIVVLLAVFLLWLGRDDSTPSTNATHDTTITTGDSKGIERMLGKHPKVKVVNCSRLFAGEESEFQTAEEHHRTHKKVVLPDASFIGIDTNCDDFRTRRGYITSHVTEEERAFPIAFSILMYKHVEQTERLLRAIYRPQNFYCIHVDLQSPNNVYDAIVSIANCFTNVFVTAKRVRVQWGSFSVLEADLFCMEELLKYKEWMYFINLTGMEFPLKTNGDLVKILKAYSGANDVIGITYKSQNRVVRERYAEKAKLHPPPFNITPIKGGVHVTLSRAFVEFMFHSQAALEFREWVKDIKVPDELYIPSLNYNAQLNAPGAYLGDPDLLEPPSLNRYKLWLFGAANIAKCHGLHRHSICVFGLRDLPNFLHQKPLFANKFLLEFEPLTYDCLEELHFEKIRDEYSFRRHFDSSYYMQTKFAKFHR